MKDIFRDRVNLFAMFALCALFGYMGIMLVQIMNAPKPEYYARSGVVVGFEADNTVVVEDTTGNIWAFSLPDISNYRYGGIVSMTINDMGTEELGDDVVSWVDWR